MAYVSLGLGRDRDGCSFKNNGCVYNIQLQRTNTDNMAEKILNACGDRETTVNLDRAQNDYTAKIDDMEKSFSFLRDAHESRIKVSLQNRFGYTRKYVI